MQLKSKHFVHSFKGGAQMENAFFSILEGHNFKIFLAPQRPPLGGFACR